jgi:ribosomal protein S27AE
MGFESSSRPRAQRSCATGSQTRSNWELAVALRAVALDRVNYNCRFRPGRQVTSRRQTHAGLIGGAAQRALRVVAKPRRLRASRPTTAQHLRDRANWRRRERRTTRISALTTNRRCCARCGDVARATLHSAAVHNPGNGEARIRRQLERRERRITRISALTTNHRCCARCGDVARRRRQLERANGGQRASARSRRIVDVAHVAERLHGEARIRRQPERRERRATRISALTTNRRYCARCGDVAPRGIAWRGDKLERSTTRRVARTSESSMTLRTLRRRRPAKAQLGIRSADPVLPGDLLGRQTA